MEITEIKEYAHTIAEYIKNYREVCREEGGDEERIPTTPLQNDIEHLVSMLDELEDKTDNTTEWIKLTTHGMIRFQCKKCDSIFSLPWEHCPKCGREVTNNIKTNVHKYNYETGKLEELK